jgi:hypothetical protein
LDELFELESDELLELEFDELLELEFDELLELEFDELFEFELDELFELEFDELFEFELDELFEFELEFDEPLRPPPDHQRSSSATRMTPSGWLVAVPPGPVFVRCAVPPSGSSAWCAWAVPDVPMRRLMAAVASHVILFMGAVSFWVSLGLAERKSDLYLLPSDVRRNSRRT